MEFQLVFLTDDKIICYKTSHEGYLKLLLAVIRDYRVRSILQ